MLYYSIFFSFTPEKKKVIALQIMFGEACIYIVFPVMEFSIFVQFTGCR